MKLKFVTFRLSEFCLLAALLSVLAGCAGSVARDTFDLGVPLVDSSSQKTIKPRDVQILITMPTAVKALDGQDIVIKGGAETISYLKNAQWGDRLPNLVQAKLVQAYENTGKIAGVGRPGDGLAVNYQILTDIRSFYVMLAGAQQRIAVVGLSIKIMDDKTGSIVASRVFKAEQPVEGVGNDQYAIALDRAFESCIADIINWSLLKVL